MWVHTGGHARRGFVEAAKVQAKGKHGRADESIELIGRLSLFQSTWPPLRIILSSWSRVAYRGRWLGNNFADYYSCPVREFFKSEILLFNLADVGTA